MKRWFEWENLGGTFDEIVSVERFTPDSLILVGRKADGSYEGRIYGWNRPANEIVWDGLGVFLLRSLRWRILAMAIFIFSALDWMAPCFTRVSMKLTDGGFPGAENGKPWPRARI